MKKILLKIRSVLRPATLITLITSVIAVGVFPNKAEEAYTSALSFLGNLPSPILPWWYDDENAQRSLALSLLKERHPAVELCVVNTSMVDVSRTGWKSDLFVEYDLQLGEPNRECGGQADRRTASVAVFGPRFFTYKHMGTIADPDGDDLPNAFYVKIIYIFAHRYWTDSPYLDVWFVHEGKVRSSDIWISLTDPAEREYEIRWQEHQDILIGWGTLEGVFHLYVNADGKLLKNTGLPNDLSTINDHAVYMDWDRNSFTGPSGEILHDDVVNGYVVKLPPLSQLYVTNCFPEHGFVESESLPGALVPVFKEKPKLSCAGSSELDENITVLIAEDKLE